MKKILIIGLVLLVSVVICTAGCTFMETDSRTTYEHEEDLGNAVADIINSERVAAGLPAFEKITVQTSKNKTLTAPTFKKASNGTYYASNLSYLPTYGHEESYHYVLPMGYVDGVNYHIATIKTDQNAGVITDDLKALSTWDDDFLDRNLKKLTVYVNYKNFDGLNYYLLSVGLD